MAENIKVKIERLINDIASKTNGLEQFANKLQIAGKNLDGAKDSLESSASEFSGKAAELAKTLQNIQSINESIENLIIEIDTVNFPERLDSIENTVGEIINNLDNIRQATIDEINQASKTIQDVDFEGKFSSLKEVVNEAVKSSDTLTQYISKLKLGEKFEKLDKSIEKQLENNFQKVENNTNKIATQTARSIHDLNFPIRMDKLDANIAGIMARIQNTQGMIQTIERNVGDKLRESYEKQAQAISNLQMQIQQNNDATQKKMQTNAYITWGILAIGMIAFWISQF